MKGKELVPRWLGPPDHGWLSALLDVYERMENRPLRELDALLATPLSPPVSPMRLRLARSVLDRLWTSRVSSSISPKEIRDAVFRAAALHPEREDAIASASTSLGMTPNELEEALFADLPNERLLLKPSPIPTANELAVRCNLAIAQGLLARSSSIRLELEGDARALVRACRLRGLLCVVRPEPTGARIDISGPLSLFRSTRVYGRALSSLVHALRGASCFRLRTTVISTETRVWTITHRDPIFPEGTRPPTFDSAVEETFAKRFLRLTPDWDLVREPAPVPVGDTLVFPDFALVHRRDPNRRWWLEIVGFWTPEYLHSKLAHLRLAGLSRLILCVSDRLACAAHELPKDARIVRFKGRVDPNAVLAAMGEPPVPASTKYIGSRKRKSHHVHAKSPDVSSTASFRLR